MIRLIEALNYRCLRYVRQELGPFHVLVGPNASGKSAFLDVLAFLGRLVKDGPEAAIRERSENPRDLVWNHEGDRFELAIELAIPEELRKQLPKPYDTVRYEVAIGGWDVTEKVGLMAETILLRNWGSANHQRRLAFPLDLDRPETILTSDDGPNCKFIYKSRENSLVFAGETSNHPPICGKGTPPYDSSILSLIGNSFSFRFQEAYRELFSAWPPSPVSIHPVSFWLSLVLANGIRTVALENAALRNESPRAQGFAFKSDGSNLPWRVASLKKDRQRFADWISHLRTALPNLVDVEVRDRKDTLNSWLVLIYEGGLQVPSWMASDGTLRLIALTLIAYLPEEEGEGVFLIEEPENGLHPRAVDTLIHSLSSVYDSQVLLTTHSAVLLSVVSLEQILCFSQTESGATDIVLGSEHPDLRNWQHETDLGTLFVAGVFE